jgi:serine/threonine protein phosphatase PrpC
LKDEIKSIIICSDGVWEFLSNEDVLKIIKPKINETPEEICKCIIRESNKCWKREDIIRDDITVVVIVF